MIYIKKDSINTIVLTLSDFYSTNPSSIAMMRIKSNQLDFTKDLIIGQDLTTDSMRYNEYLIIENVIENLSAGIIYLPIGTYDYEVYEVDAGGVIISDVYEIGLLTSFDDDNSSPVFNNNNDIEYTFQ